MTFPKNRGFILTPLCVAKSCQAASFGYSPAAKPRDRVISASTTRLQAPHGIVLWGAEHERQHPKTP